MFLTIGLIAIFSGCGKPDYYKCGGVVSLDGKPIPQLQINFIPEDVNIRPPVGMTDDKGHFDMTSGSEYGVPPGKYKIEIVDPGAADGRKTSTEPDYVYVVGRYNSAKTDLTYEANSHQSNYEIKLTK